MHIEHASGACYGRTLISTRDCKMSSSKGRGVQDERAQDANRAQDADVKGPRKKQPKMPEFEVVPEEDDFSDDEIDEMDFVDTVSAFMVSSDGVTLADSLVLLAKTAMNLSESFDRFSHKMVKLAKIQAAEIKNIASVLVPRNLDAGSEEGDDEAGDGSEVVDPRTEAGA